MIFIALHKIYIWSFIWLTVHQTNPILKHFEDHLAKGEADINNQGTETTPWLHF